MNGPTDEQLHENALEGHAHHRAGKYQLTDRGQEELADRVPAAAAAAS